MTAEWVDNGAYIDLTRLTDGRIMCQLCFNYCTREELQEIEPGIVTDVCIPCWEEDQKAVARKHLTYLRGSDRVAVSAFETVEEE